MLKVAANLCDPSLNAAATSVTFKGGQMMSTNNKVFFCGEAGIEGHFAIHRDVAVALTKFKSPVVAYAENPHTIKFIFESGASLCAHKMELSLPDIDFLFAGEWVPFTATGTEDIECEYFHFVAGSVRYYSADSVGELVDSVTGDVDVKVFKKTFDHLAGGDLSLSECGRRVKSVKEKCVLVGSVKI
jgi:hypothetical protein